MNKLKSFKQSNLSWTKAIRIYAVLNWILAGHMLFLFYRDAVKLKDKTFVARALHISCQHQVEGYGKKGETGVRLRIGWQDSLFCCCCVLYFKCEQSSRFLLPSQTLCIPSRGFAGVSATNMFYYVRSDLLKDIGPG